MTAPDFVVAGAQKAGTTSLYVYLRQHPDLFLPSQKEPHFFCAPGDGSSPAWTGPGDAALMRSMTFDPAGYTALFADAGDRRRGEMSTMYLHDPAVPDRLVRANPEVRVVVLLREPVARAHSAWWMWRRSHLEPLDFADALAAEPARRAAGWGPNFAYRGIGRYAEHLERWRAVLPAAQMLVLRSDALRDDRLATVQAVFGFLGVDASFEPDVTRELNDDSGPRPRVAPRGRHPLRSLRVRARRIAPWVRDAPPLPRRRPPLDDVLAAALRAAYADDRHRTEAMLGWDLRDWA